MGHWTWEKWDKFVDFPVDFTVLYLVANQSAHGHTRVNAHDFVFILSQSLAFFNTMLQLIEFE